eukprot:TRINITY_DN28853_c0_g1_i1.p1 TRINITY_DN28853_c0_g1~~TRINITY_DN28853_c0_g1_i1.p1  ORF type:complete len:610 (+),score=142.75 TRINITY_DN28853_c0_g1_i1:127-1956(+)
MIRRPPRSTLSSSSAASDVYKRQTPEHARAMDKARKRERRLQAELARCALDLERERERGVAQVRGLEGKLEVVEGKVQQLEAQLRERCCEAGKRETTGGSDKSGACCQAMKLLPGMVKRLKECSEDHEDTMRSLEEQTRRTAVLRRQLLTVCAENARLNEMVRECHVGQGKVMELQHVNEGSLEREKRMLDKICRLNQACASLAQQKDALYRHGKVDFDALQRIRPVVQNWLSRRRLRQFIQSTRPEHIARLHNAEVLVQQMLFRIQTQRQNVTATIKYLQTLQPALAEYIGKYEVDPYGFRNSQVDQLLQALEVRRGAMESATVAVGEIVSEEHYIWLGPILEQICSDRINIARVINLGGQVYELILEVYRRFTDDFRPHVEAAFKHIPPGASDSSLMTGEYLFLVGVNNQCAELLNFIEENHVLHTPMSNAGRVSQRLLDRLNDTMKAFDTLNSLQGRLRFVQIPPVEILAEKVEVVKRGDMTTMGVDDPEANGPSADCHEGCISGGRMACHTILLSSHLLVVQEVDATEEQERTRSPALLVLKAVPLEDQVSVVLCDTLFSFRVHWVQGEAAILGLQLFLKDIEERDEWVEQVQGVLDKNCQRLSR